MNTELQMALTLPNGLHWVSLTQPQGRITPVHQHAIGQLFGTEKGLLTADFEHSQWAIPATHAVWVPAACPHGMRSHGAFHGWSVYMGQDLTSQLPAQPKTFLVEGLLREALKRVKRWQGEETPQQAQHALTTVILEEIRCAPDSALELPMPKDARLLRVTRGLLNDVSVQHNAEQWANGRIVGQNASETVSLTDRSDLHRLAAAGQNSASHGVISAGNGGTKRCAGCRLRQYQRLYCRVSSSYRLDARAVSSSRLKQRK